LTVDFEARQMLSRLRVVLVETKFPGNLGFAARTMMNFGLSDLRLVSPRAVLDKEAYTLALGGASILDDAMIHKRLEDAVSDCGIVIGTSRRHGVKRRNVIDPREMAALLRPVLEVNDAALVIGSEDVGLSNDHLALCNWVAGIHSGTDYESFNLSHALAVFLWEINYAVRKSHESHPRKLASTRDQENMFRHLERVLLEIGFIKEKDPRRMMILIRQMLHRACLTDREVRIMRGILRQIRWRIDNPEAGVKHDRLKEDRRGK
jgi:TrmH family RNA methyltransferase